MGVEYSDPIHRRLFVTGKEEWPAEFVTWPSDSENFTGVYDIYHNYMCEAGTYINLHNIGFITSIP